jgi:hypothetical protein
MKTSKNIEFCNVFTTYGRHVIFIYIFWNELEIFLRGSIKFLGSDLKYTRRVGRVNGNAKTFYVRFGGLVDDNHIRPQRETRVYLFIFTRIKRRFTPDLA